MGVLASESLVSCNTPRRASLAIDAGRRGSDSCRKRRVRSRPWSASNELNRVSPVTTELGETRGRPKIWRPKRRARLSNSARVPLLTDRIASRQTMGPKTLLWRIYSWSVGGGAGGCAPYRCTSCLPRRGCVWREADLCHCGGSLCRCLCRFNDRAATAAAVAPAAASAAADAPRTGQYAMASQPT